MQSLGLAPLPLLLFSLPSVFHFLCKPCSPSAPCRPIRERKHAQITPRPRHLGESPLSKGLQVPLFPSARLPHTPVVSVCRGGRAGVFLGPWKTWISEALLSPIIQTPIPNQRVKEPGLRSFLKRKPKSREKRRAHPNFEKLIPPEGETHSRSCMAMLRSWGLGFEVTFGSFNFFWQMYECECDAFRLAGHDSQTWSIPISTC